MIKIDNPYKTVISVEGSPKYGLAAHLNLNEDQGLRTMHYCGRRSKFCTWLGRNPTCK